MIISLFPTLAETSTYRAAMASQKGSGEDIELKRAWGKVEKGAAGGAKSLQESAAVLHTMSADNQLNDDDDDDQHIGRHCVSWLPLNVYKFGSK